MVKEAGMTMEVSDRYEAMPEDFQKIVRKSDLNLSMYMDLYLNSVSKIPKNSDGWKRVQGLIEGQVLRC